MKTLLFSLLVLLLSSCSLFQTAKDYVLNNIEIKWKKDASKDTLLIDSMRVKFDEVYWVESKELDSLNNDEEIEFFKNSYRIWILKTDEKRYNEVKKQDTIIYIYRKK